MLDVRWQRRGARRTLGKCPCDGDQGVSAEGVIRVYDNRTISIFENVAYEKLAAAALLREDRKEHAKAATEPGRAAREGM